MLSSNAYYGCHSWFRGKVCFKKLILMYAGKQLLQFHTGNLSLGSLYPFKIIIPLKLIFWLPLQVWYRNERERWPEALGGVWRKEIRENQRLLEESRFWSKVCDFCNVTAAESLDFVGNLRSWKQCILKGYLTVTQNICTYLIHKFKLTYWIERKDVVK